MTIRTLYLPVMVAAAVLACVVAAVTTLLVVSKEAESAFPGKSGRIAFSATTPDPASPGLNWQIFTINPDGTSEKQLTRTYDSAWLNSSPSYSSDGKKIAWIKHGNIWVMDADGTGKVRLTCGRTDGDPAFSPDGRRLAFTRCDGIWVKKLKGGKDARRVTAKNDGYEEYGPVFRPGGGRIAFVRYKAVGGCGDCPGKSEIATVRPDGTGLKVLTHTPGADPDAPDWSPDGRRLVFVLYMGSVYVYNGARIQTVEADGTKRRTVFAPVPRFTPYDPVFSPDGTKIAFGKSDFGENDDVWTIGADGTNPTNVTDTPKRREAELDWGPRPATKR